MSTLESVCDRTDALAEAALQYLSLRKAERSFEAARVRKRFDQLANDALAESRAARSKRAEALRTAKPALSGLCRCGCPACPQPSITPANDASSEAPNLA